MNPWPPPFTAKGNPPDCASWYRACCTWEDIPGGATPLRCDHVILDFGYMRIAARLNLDGWRFVYGTAK